jgi:hypothetical protein
MTDHWQIPLLNPTPLMTSSMPTSTQLSISVWATASSSQGSKGLDPSTSDYTMSTPTPSVTAALDQSAATTTSTLAPVMTDAGSYSLSPTAQHVLISAATIGMLL